MTILFLFLLMNAARSQAKATGKPAILLEE